MPDGTCGSRSPLDLTAGDALWTPCNAAFGDRYFDIFRFDFRTGGLVRFSMFSDEFRPWVHFYKEKSFDPDKPCNGSLANHQASPGQTVAQNNVTVAPGKYVVVATSAADDGGPSPTGEFSVSWGIPTG